MNYEAVLFDLDGVLIKSEEIWFRVVEEAGRRFRGRAITREEFAPTFGQGTEADLRVFGLKTDRATLDRFYAENFVRYADAVWVNPESRPVLEALRARGQQLAVVTNTMQSLAKRLVEAAKIDEFFPVLACADLVPKSKPAPDLVLYACEKLGVSTTKAAMVGDSKYDRGAANAAGVFFVGLGLDGDRRIERLADLPALVA